MTNQDQLAGLTPEQKEVVLYHVRVLKDNNDDSQDTFEVLKALKERDDPAAALALAQRAIETWKTDPKVRRVYALEVEDIRRRIAADKATADS